MEEMKLQEKERLRQSKSNLLKSQSQEELEESPEAKKKPFSPDTRVFSPKEALNQQTLRASMNSQNESIAKQMQRSMGSDNEMLAPQYSMSKLKNTPYDHSQYFTIASHESPIQEGKKQQALKRFEEYERKRRKIIK